LIREFSSDAPRNNSISLISSISTRIFCRIYHIKHLHQSCWRQNILWNALHLAFTYVI
jgi:hypothetical protein